VPTSMPTVKRSLHSFMDYRLDSLCQQNKSLFSNNFGFLNCSKLVLEQQMLIKIYIKFLSVFYSN